MALNPVAFTEAVVDDFLRYQLTTYPLADPGLYAQLRALLQLEQTRKTPLRQGPFVSLSRPFKQGASIEQLIKEGIFHGRMASLVPYPNLRVHQEQAIRSIHEGQTTLVSTGTGSGKTEAFLYPIINRCLALKEQEAPAGIVAVLIYPMNALAEDQLDRLRGLLAGSGIPFGMYVGKTPGRESQVRGERMPVGSTQAAYRARLQQIREAGQTQSLLPPEEKASREAMRTKGGQPRILLTNGKQLELLLTRGKDLAMFAEAPLEYLVFDEAHTFRGVQGAETACLIRRLRTFCGKEARDVRHIATSATMADPEGGDGAARSFGRRFFGVDDAKVTLVREVYDDLRWNERRAIPAAPSRDPHEILSGLLKSVEQSEEEVAEALSVQMVDMGGARLPEKGWQNALASQLVSNELVYQLAGALEKPRALLDLQEELHEKVGRFVSEAEILAWLALGAATGRGGNDPLLRPVVHSFVRGVGGAVATLTGPEGSARLWLAGEDAVAAQGEEAKRFPIITCTTCGQHYYETWVQDFTLLSGKRDVPKGGERRGKTNVWPYVPDATGGCRVLFLDRLVIQAEEDGPEEVDEEGEVEQASGHDIEHSRLYPMHLCGRCGSLQKESDGECLVCGVQTPPVAVQVVRSKREYEGLLHACVSCRTPGKRPMGGRYREPARPIRAVGVSDVHVLAQSMIHLSERPRLLVFADNRQDAAFQAGWMRDHARRFRLRAMMYQQIKQGEPISIGDLVSCVDKEFEQDTELSNALLPEVWQIEPYEESSIKHREERRYFLRLQVLRELTTSVKQRVGLEPWGRLKITYRGIEEEDPFVVKWSGRLEVSPSSFLEGVAAVLDLLRRNRLLSDPTQLFETHWKKGDKEIQYGYFPAFAGGPKGAALRRTSQQEAGRVSHWLGTHATQLQNAVELWGVKEEDLEAFLKGLWEMLCEKKLLVPVTLKGWGKVLKGSAGVRQIDSSKLVLHTHKGRYRCEKCRRTTTRPSLRGVCMAWRCGGHLGWEEEAADDFDLRVLDGNYAMLRVAEHSAQVPHEAREWIENQFKGEGEQLNVLVCTPTLELGVDIGSLDTVLMRNVPPTAANYWQRAGRAGRRHRMAVDLTYAQATSFDQAYFREPLKLLRGQVEPPRFNLKNRVMLRKHVHATALTTLYGLAREAASEERQRIEEILFCSFPPLLRGYLFTAGGEVLPTPLDLAGLGALIKEKRGAILERVKGTFQSSWPEEDRDAVEDGFLENCVDEMAGSLHEVILHWKRRLDWALGEQRRLHGVESKRGTLDPEDAAQRKRCGRVIARLKGEAFRGRKQAEGGADDPETMGALAREGFLPGYGLESGSVVGIAELPRMTRGLEDFELPRSPTVALREYVPGNAIYANGFRFVPRRFLLSPEEGLRFRINASKQVVKEAGVAGEQADLSAEEIRAVPTCDVIMPSQSQISDEEEFRFQMPVSIYGNDRGYHRGGQAWTWGEFDLRLRRGVHLRLVNVGSRSEVAGSRLGFPLCLACGQSHSPFASQRSRMEFEKLHEDRCKHRVEPTGFYADVEVDVLGFHDIKDRRVGLSVVESVRMGAARVLEMEVEDLQILVLGHETEEDCDVLLYDPMPGGSGLLESIVERWENVREAALDLVEHCPSACGSSCIDCLRTYRNRVYHDYFDRWVASDVLRKTLEPLLEAYPIPENLPKTSSTTGQGQTWIENRFKRFLSEAGLPSPECQHPIDLGSGFGRTIPDFFYVLEDEGGLCVYLDGMAGHIHGNAEQAEKDRALRERLRSLDYEVVEIRSFELDDRTAVVQAITRIAKKLAGKSKQQELREDTDWFDRGMEELGQKESPRPGLRLLEGGRAHEERRKNSPAPDDIPFRVVVPAESEKYKQCVPLIPLEIAAGRFGAPQEANERSWIWIELEGKKRLTPDLFVARVIGESMNRRIPNGAWCLWRFHPKGERQGKVILAQHRDICDPELGGSYTVKLYESEKVADSDGTWRHQKVLLKPDSNDPNFETILFEDAEEGELRIVAELIEVMKI